MRRDMDLVREILLQVEAWPEPNSWVELSFPGRPQDEVSYQVEIMVQAGLIKAQDLSTLSGYEWRPVSLIWAGHEFLDAARDDTVWGNAKKRLGAEFESAPFEVVRAVLVEIVKSSIGL